MKITGVDCTVLVVPDCNSAACDSSQDTVVVEIRSDEGITGIGEVDTNPWVVKTLVVYPGSHIMSLGLKQLLLDQDPTQPQAIWDRLYTLSAMTGRRGAGICAIGAIDMAIWDLYGKACVATPRWSAATARHSLCQLTAHRDHTRRVPREPVGQSNLGA